MAKVNLLNASFVGKLGEVYGVQQWGNAYAKAVPFSHSPHSQTQTKCVRAFECLNRFSSALSAIGFKYLGISDKKMLKHNAVAKLFKPLISSKTFNPSELENIITDGDATQISTFEIDDETNEITVSASTSEAVDKKSGHAWFVMVFDLFGNVYICECPDESFITKTVKITALPSLSLCCAVFRSDKKLTKFSLNNLSLIVPMVISDSIFYTSRTVDPNKWSVEAETLVYSGTESYISDGVLHVR